MAPVLLHLDGVAVILWMGIFNPSFPGSLDFITVSLVHGLTSSCDPYHNIQHSCFNEQASLKCR